jgi:hypothetical protein
MAQNPIPTSISELLSLAELCLNGIATKGASIGLLQWTTANFNPKVTALQTKQSVFEAKRALTLGEYDGLHSAEAALRAYLLTGRKLLSVSWGDEWNTQWVQGGWDNHTTAVPRKLAPLKSIGLAVKNLLTADISYEVETARIVFTALGLGTLLTPLGVAETTVAAAKSAQKSAGDDRGTAEETLRTALRSLIDVLAGLIPPDSPIWDDFGLNRPGAHTTPGQPAAPTLEKTGPTQVTATVPPVPLATYYRWKYRIAGVDPEFRFAGRTYDPVKILADLPLTGTLEVLCEAANEAGPGVPSEVATLELA